MKTPPILPSLMPVPSFLALALMACLSLPAAMAQNAVVPAEKIKEALDKPLTRSLKLNTRSGKELQAAVATRGAGAQSALRSLTAVSVVVDPQANLSLTSIQFKLNSATELADEASRKQLSVLAEVLKGISGAKFLIEGHTCSIGSVETNDRLSAERAEFVMKSLISAGVSADSLRAIGVGEAEPEKAGVSPQAGEAVLAPYRKVMLHKIVSE